MVVTFAKLMTKLECFLLKIDKIGSGSALSPLLPSYISIYMKMMFDPKNSKSFEPKTVPNSIINFRLQKLLLKIEIQ